MECRGYIVIQGYVPMHVSLPRVVNLLEKSGSRIVSINEDIRRIVANVSLKKSDKVLDLCMEMMHNCLVEVKYSCKNHCLKRLARHGFKVIGNIGYGVIHGRIVEVEESRSGIRVKIGVKTVIARPSPPIPPSMFLLDPGDSREAASDSVKILEWLGGVCDAGK